MCQTKAHQKLTSVYSHTKVFSLKHLLLVEPEALLIFMIVLLTASLLIMELPFKMTRQCKTDRPPDVSHILQNVCQVIVAERRTKKPTDVAEINSSFSEALVTIDIRVDSWKVTVQRVEVKTAEDDIFMFFMSVRPSILFKILTAHGQSVKSDKEDSNRLGGVIEDVSNCITERCISNRWIINNTNVQESGSTVFSVQSQCLIRALPKSKYEWLSHPFLIFCWLALSAIFLSLVAVLRVLKATQRNVAQVLDKMNEIKDTVNEMTGL